MTNLKLSATWLIVAVLLSVTTPAFSQSITSRSLAEKHVKSQNCNGNDNIDDYISTKSRHNQPDLGWRVFTTDDGGFDVERAYMISKGTEIRYRWHVDSQGTIRPINQRAEDLCS
jgi:hypothetical protein